MTSRINYEGKLRTSAVHLQSNSTIETDAPIDNQGNGERFSPTDLVATALGSCMLTIMGIKARDLGLEDALKGTQINITKQMAAEPRRISGIVVEFIFPEALPRDEKTKTILERAALTCPVAKSIHPDIHLDVSFRW